MNIGDKVIPNGKRWGSRDNSHYYGTTSKMLLWEKEKTVLVIKYIDLDWISAGPENSDTRAARIYHPAELDLAP